MKHAVLLGDSIFDNAAYVQGDLPVINQLRQELPIGGWGPFQASDHKLPLLERGDRFSPTC
jgi:hypothetical protein